MNLGDNIRVADPRNPNERPVYDAAGMHAVIRGVTRHKAQKTKAKAEGGPVDERKGGYLYGSLDQFLAFLKQMDFRSTESIRDKILATGEVETARDADGRVWVDSASRANWWRHGGRERLAQLNREQMRQSNDVEFAKKKQPSAEELSRAARVGDGLAAERLRQQRAAEVDAA